MFVLALTSYGVSQRLLTYDRMSDALARAAMTPQTEADKSKIYKAPSVDEKPGGASVVDLSKGVYVGAVETATMSQNGAQLAKAQLLAAMAPAMLGESRSGGAAASSIETRDARALQDEAQAQMASVKRPAS
jgi:hypothetical protein